MADAYVGSREDVAIWKRRALEAEQKVRVLDQRIDQLVLDAQGETRMGEPYIAPPAAGVLEQMSEEARSTLVGMVEYCLNARVCMGMDEGFKSFEPEVEHDFVKELRAFAEGAPTPPAAGVPETVHVLRKAYEGNSAGLFNSGAPKHLWSAAMLELFESLDEEVQEEARETVMAHSDMRAVAAIDSVIALLAATTPPASEQQQAVVMPERKEIPDQATFPGGPAYYAKEFDKARAHNACLDELLRLNACSRQRRAKGIRMKTHPLEIESVGSDTYIVMSRGHHNLDEFMREAVKQYPDWQLGGPVHVGQVGA